MGITVTREEAVWLRKQHPSGRIVAACGCFDIFHIGHLEYLEAAARLGDALFVGGQYRFFRVPQQRTFPLFSSAGPVAASGGIGMCRLCISFFREVICPGAVPASPLCFGTGRRRLGQRLPRRKRLPLFENRGNTGWNEKKSVLDTTAHNTRAGRPSLTEAA